VPRSREGGALNVLISRGASVSKIAALVVGLLLLPAIALAQQQAELNIGWLNYSAGTISQDLSVKTTVCFR
jgi:hypothetical protein